MFARVRGFLSYCLAFDADFLPCSPQTVCPLRFFISRNTDCLFLLKDILEEFQMFILFVLKINRLQTVTNGTECFFFSPLMMMMNIYSV